MQSFSLLLAADVLGKPAWAWLLFAGLVATLLAFDLGVLHRKQREIGVRESLWLSAGYVAAGLLFGAWVWWGMGQDAGVAYLTAFVVEKTLALDNVFVISMIFGAFAIPRAYQHRVLLYGILGVIVLRGIIIGAGAALVQQASWVLFVFAGVLVVTGVRMLAGAGHGVAAGQDSVAVRLARRVLPITDGLRGDRFTVREPGPDGRLRRFGTPLLLALIAVEFADLVFAIDSVPAVLAITSDPYVVYTSNIFAILGLRALYFALAALLHRFTHLKYALAAVLVFIGAKIVWHELVGKVDPLVSLGVTVGLLGGGLLASWAATARWRDARPGM